MPTANWKTSSPALLEYAQYIATQTRSRVASCAVQWERQAFDARRGGGADSSHSHKRLHSTPPHLANFPASPSPAPLPSAHFPSTAHPSRCKVLDPECFASPHGPLSLVGLPVLREAVSPMPGLNHLPLPCGRIGRWRQRSAHGDLALQSKRNNNAMHGGDST